jgi:hypothetical protein
VEVVTTHRAASQAAFQGFRGASIVQRAMRMASGTVAILGEWFSMGT